MSNNPLSFIDPDGGYDYWDGNGPAAGDGGSATEGNNAGERYYGPESKAWMNRGPRGGLSAGFENTNAARTYYNDIANTTIKQITTTTTTSGVIHVTQANGNEVYTNVSFEESSTKTIVDRSGGWLSDDPLPSWMTLSNLGLSISGVEASGEVIAHLSKEKIPVFDDAGRVIGQWLVTSKASIDNLKNLKAMTKVGGGVMQVYQLVSMLWMFIMGI